MQDEFKIFINRLKNGQETQIEEKVSSAFLDVKESELSFSPEVFFKGQAYLADDHLIVNLKVNATAIIPCKICNDPVPVAIFLPELVFIQPIQEILSPIFDFSSLLREAILLEVPPFTECHGNACPEREHVNKFFKKNTLKEKQYDHFFPFSSL